jgi:hypothetical protein
MNWQQMCDLEPGLTTLEADIIRFKATKKRLGTCVMGDWYDRFKPRMCELVGWRARNPELQSDRVYSAVYQYLDDLLSYRKPPKHKPEVEL